MSQKSELSIARGLLSWRECRERVWLTWEILAKWWRVSRIKLPPPEGIPISLDELQAAQGFEGWELRAGKFLSSVQRRLDAAGGVQSAIVDVDVIEREKLAPQGLNAAQTMAELCAYLTERAEYRRGQAMLTIGGGARFGRIYGSFLQHGEDCEQIEIRVMGRWRHNIRWCLLPLAGWKPVRHRSAAT